MTFKEFMHTPDSHLDNLQGKWRPRELPTRKPSMMNESASQNHRRIGGKK